MKKMIIIILIFLLSIGIVNAVWWNPLGWFEETERLKEEDIISSIRTTNISQTITLTKTCSNSFYCSWKTIKITHEGTERLVYNDSFEIQGGNTKEVKVRKVDEDLNFLNIQKEDKSFIDNSLYDSLDISNITIKYILENCEENICKFLDNSSFVQVFTSNSDLIGNGSDEWRNNTEARAIGISLMHNDNWTETGLPENNYNFTIGHYNSLVFYNSSSTTWNTTLSVADSDGSAEVKDLCDADNDCVLYFPLDNSQEDNVHIDTVSQNNLTFNGITNATGISSGAIYSNLTSYANNTPFTLMTAGSDDIVSSSFWFKSAITNYVELQSGIVAKRDEFAFLVTDEDDYSIGTYGGNMDSESCGSVDLNWHHYYFEYDEGANTGKIYQDGQLLCTGTLSDDSAVGGYGLQIGALDSSGTQKYVDGFIDEVTVYNNSKTVAEIEALYKAGLSQHANTNITLETRTATDYNITDDTLHFLIGNTNKSHYQVCDNFNDSCFSQVGFTTIVSSSPTCNNEYLQRFTAVWEFPTAYANWSFNPEESGEYEVYVTNRFSSDRCPSAVYNMTHDDGQMNNVISQASGGTTGVPIFLGDVNLTVGNRYDLLFSACNVTGGNDRHQADSAMIVKKGTHPILDLSGNNNEFNVSFGCLLDENGVVGNSFGANLSSYQNQGTTWMHGWTGLTISGWIYTFGDNQYDSILMYRGNEIIGLLSDTNVWRFQIESPSEILTHKIDSNEEWLHVAGTFDGGNNYSLYINGIIVNTSSTAVTNLNVNDYWYLARDDTGRNTKGYLDEIRVYNRSLGSDEIKNLYELGDYHIEWNDWQDEGKVEDLIPVTSSNEGNFFQYKANFNSDDLNVSPYVINHTINTTEVISGNNPTWTFIPNNVSLEYKLEILLVDFNATGDSAITYSINDTSYFEINETNGTLMNTSFIPIANYDILVTATDTEALSNTTVFQVNVSDTMGVYVSTIYPVESIDRDNWTTIVYQVSDPNSVANATLFINGVQNGSTVVSPSENTDLYFTRLLDEGFYSYTINASDSSGNIGTNTSNFTVDDSPWEVNGTIVLDDSAIIIRQCLK